VSGDVTSLLCRFLLHFKRPEDGKDYVVMGNCLPGYKEWHGLYDLKGCRDDKTMMEHGKPIPEVHMRFWNVGMQVQQHVLGTHKSPERERYYLGKKRAFQEPLATTSEHCEQILASIRYDCGWLAQHGLMDYSLVLGTRTCNLEEVGKEMNGERGLKTGRLPNQPWVSKHEDGQAIAYYMGLIDFLQEWTPNKKAAAVIKGCFAPKPVATISPERYAVQFATHMEKHFVGGSDPVVPSPLLVNGIAIPPLSSSSSAFSSNWTSPKLRVHEDSESGANDSDNDDYSNPHKEQL